MDLTVAGAVAFIVQDLAEYCARKRQKDYGYHICPSGVAQRWAFKQLGNNPGQNVDAVAGRNSPQFYEGSWELCRRGILRPGIEKNGDQAIDDGGYCLTVSGRQWFDQGNFEDVVLLESGSLSKVLADFRPRFGDGYFQRSQEAIRCRNAEAWLACCAMVGAASESVLLALALAKTKDGAKVIADYGSRDGRRKITNMLVGGHPKHLAETLKTFLGLLSYWRDEAAHGEVSELGVANSDEALRQLLHLVQWADKNWDVLTT